MLLFARRRWSVLRLPVPAPSTEVGPRKSPRKQAPWLWTTRGRWSPAGWSGRGRPAELDRNGCPASGAHDLESYRCSRGEGAQQATQITTAGNGGVVAANDDVLRSNPGT